MNEDPEDGFTLVELLIAAILLGVVMTISTMAMISTLTTTGRASSKVVLSGQSQVAVEAMAKDLRNAVRRDITTTLFLPAGTTVGSQTVTNNASSVWFYANLSPTTTFQCGPQVVHLYVNASHEIWEERTNPDSALVGGTWAYTGQPTLKRRLASNVVLLSEGAPPLFTYTATIGGASLASTDTARTLTDTQASSVGDVLLSLSTRTTGTRGTSTAQTQAVRLINADAIAGGAAGC